jgi:hypothetical protein
MTPVHAAGPWELPKAATQCDRNYTAMHTHVRRSVHLSALLITWFTWGDGVQRRYASDVAFCIVRFPLTARANQEKGVARTDGSAHSQDLREFTTRSPVEKANKLMTQND